jgi:hypothetical protein
VLNYFFDEFVQKIFEIKIDIKNGLLCDTKIWMGAKQTKKDYKIVICVAAFKVY